MGSVLPCVAIHTKSRRDMLNTLQKKNLNCSQYGIYSIKKDKKFKVAQNVTSAQEAPQQTRSSMGHIILQFLKISLFPSSQVKEKQKEFAHCVGQ